LRALGPLLALGLEGEQRPGRSAFSYHGCFLMLETHETLSRCQKLGLSQRDALRSDDGKEQAATSGFARVLTPLG